MIAGTRKDCCSGDFWGWMMGRLQLLVLSVVHGFEQLVDQAERRDVYSDGEGQEELHRRSQRFSSAHRLSPVTMEPVGPQYQNPAFHHPA